MVAAQAPAPIPTAQTTQGPQSATSVRYGVSLQDAVDTVRTTIETSSQGATQARIELSPPSLGTIRIQLQRTDSGVTAHVVTDHAATADTLSQGGDDLKRQLANAGVNLLSLNIESRGGGNGAQSQGQASTSGSTQATDPDQIDVDADASQPSTSVPGSALVNVLA
ncbi:MAG TPA: flagellar hook-length control protein FliK [Solirubrobacteraceae bacterium]|nr:flagellar hook-length control protein FliK [Solirubrobacteraceae bacterium]